MEASYIVFLLQPHHKNFNKRTIKSPKLYFYDTGLAASLLRIETEQQLQSHYLRGGLFENLVIAELLKQTYNKVKQPNLYFWRDSQGNEIDCLLEHPNSITPIEIKSGSTINSNYFKGLQYWQKLEGETTQQFVVYGGDKTEKRTQGTVLGWKEFTQEIEL